MQYVFTVTVREGHFHYIRPDICNIQPQSPYEHNWILSSGAMMQILSEKSSVSSESQAFLLPGRVRNHWYPSHNFYIQTDAKHYMCASIRAIYLSVDRILKRKSYYPCHSTDLITDTAKETMRLIDDCFGPENPTIPLLPRQIIRSGSMSFGHYIWPDCTLMFNNCCTKRNKGSVTTPPLQKLSLFGISDIIRHSGQTVKFRLYCSWIPTPCIKLGIYSPPFLWLQHFDIIH